LEAAMPKPMQIEFVSDVVCPWCVIGLRGLEKALSNLKDVVDPTITLQPFELNPQMVPEGEDLNDHIAKKYGARPPEQMAAIRETLQTRAKDLGFAMANRDGSRIYNTFDAHRLLHWAETQDKAIALKHELFGAYFQETQNVADHDVLVAAAERAGLDATEARKVLADGRYAQDVREAERTWLTSGINSVPAVVVNRKYLISGGQPAEAFEEALRNIAAQI